jgi:hypothetical protein
MRTMMVVVLVVGAVAGCGTTARSEWVYAKPGVSETQRERDEQACRMASVGTADIKQMPTWGQTMNREAFNDCMRARGYDVRLGLLRP